MNRKSPSFFTRVAKGSSRLMGRPVTFTMALLLVLAWAISGPIFGYSDTWQLTINTGTTIVTFLMVFLIQATQNRDAEAIQIKLDEIIRSQAGAHNALLDLEELDEKTLDTIRARYRKLAAKAREDIQNGKLDVGCEDVEEDEAVADAAAKAAAKKD